MLCVANREKMIFLRQKKKKKTRQEGRQGLEGRRTVSCWFWLAPETLEEEDRKGIEYDTFSFPSLLQFSSLEEGLVVCRL